MKEHYYSFANEKWKEELIRAYTFRFKEAPEFKEASDHITTSENPNYKDGYDNISLLAKESFSAGVKASLRCSFDGLGCPEIIIVKKPEMCDDGFVRFGEHFEVVLWKNGVNVWRHFMDESYKCSWHRRLGVTRSVTEKDIHELEVRVEKGYISFSVDGINATLRTEDLFDSFYIGVTACEGIVRLYDFKIESLD